MREQQPATTAATTASIKVQPTPGTTTAWIESIYEHQQTPTSTTATTQALLIPTAAAAAAPVTATPINTHKHPTTPNNNNK